MLNLNVSPASLDKATRRALGITRRDMRKHERRLAITRMAREIARMADVADDDNDIMALIESEGAGYNSNLSAFC